MKQITLKPSILIIHNCKLRGGINYRVMERAEERYNERGERAEWRTERVISDKQEFDTARALRARLENAIRTATGAARSDIGLIAPDAPETFTALEAAEADALAEIDAFHADAYYTRLQNQIITFKIGDNDRAVRAVAATISDGLEELRRAVAAVDVKAIRDALKDLKGLDAVLDGPAAPALADMMDTLRQRARTIAAEVKKTGAALDETTARQFADTAIIEAAELAIFTDTAEAADALDTFDDAELLTDTTTTEAVAAGETLALEFEADGTTAREARDVAALDGAELAPDVTEAAATEWD